MSTVPIRNHHRRGYTRIGKLPDQSTPTSTSMPNECATDGSSHAKHTGKWHRLRHSFHQKGGSHVIIEWHLGCSDAPLLLLLLIKPFGQRGLWFPQIRAEVPLGAQPAREQIIAARVVSRAPKLGRWGALYPCALGNANNAPLDQKNHSIF